MAFLQIDDACFHYDLAGPKEAPVLVLANSLGTDLDLWRPQLADFSRHFRVLRYDLRGHGKSSVPPGPYRIGQLADDVVALLDNLRIERANFCGLSIGGMIGLSLALRFPHRLHKAVLCNTSPKIGTAEMWNARITAVRSHGMQAIVEAVLERWYTPAFRASAPEAIESTRQMLLATPAEGYVGCCAAIRDMDQRDAISAIRVPVMIIFGVHDPVMPVSDAQFMVQQIPNAQSAEMPVAHLSNIEAAPLFTEKVLQFLRK